MKISKVNHRRTAVANKEENIGGVLYHVPGKDTIDLYDQMLSRDRDVKKLYNIFNQIQIGDRPKEWKNNEKLSQEENKRREQQQNIKIKVTVQDPFYKTKNN